MKKFLRQLVFFVVFAGFSYVLLIIAWGEFVPRGVARNFNYPRGASGFMFTRVREIPAHANLDILFLGSSHAYRGFDTRIFRQHGYSSFNLGSSAQSPIQTKTLLQKYLDALNPGMIIYEVYPGTLSIDGVESSLDLIANDRISWETLNMVLKVKHIKSYNAFIYGCFRSLVDRSSNFGEKREQGVDKYIPGGYVERAVAFFQDKSRVTKRRWKPREQQVKAFDELIAIIKAKQIKLLLVQAPVTQTLYRSYTNTSEIDRFFSRRGAYINFNEILGLSDSLHFYDLHHLNQDGVKIFDSALISRISGITVK